MSIGELTEEQIKEVQAGRAIYAPFVPLQVTGTYLWEPSAVDRLAALEDDKLRERIEDYDGLRVLMENLNQHTHGGGTVTGRFSSSSRAPNLANMPKRTCPRSERCDSL